MKKFLVIFLSIFFLVGLGHSTVTADNVPTDVSVFPDVTYYETKDGITKEFYPAVEFPIIVHMRLLPPLNKQISIFWIDYNANMLTFVHVDIDEGLECESAFIFAFEDVNTTLSIDWAIHQPTYGGPVDCALFYETLATQLEISKGK